MTGLPPEGWPNRAFSTIVPVAPHRWHVQTLGEGPTALFLHGAGGSAHSWAPLADILRDRHRLIMPDLPGHGFTQSPKGRSRLPQVAQDLGALLSTRGEVPALVVAHSAGAAIALEMIRHELIAPHRLVIMNGALEDFKGTAGWLFPVIAKVLALNPLTGLFLSSGAQSTAQARSLIRSTGSDLPEDLLAPYAHLIGKRSHVDGTLSMMAQWSLAELGRALPQIETPTLFLHGDEDTAVELGVAERAATAMPHAELRILNGLGHLAHEEAPGRVADAVADFAEMTTAN